MSSETNLRISYHGGLCCGIMHIHGFNFLGISQADKVVALRRLVSWNSLKTLEVVLNQKEVETMPSILMALAKHCFVLDGKFKNQSGTLCYRFTRMKDRRPLTLKGWKALGGTTIKRSLGGLLPEEDLPVSSCPKKGAIRNVG
jgi:hypothetical protein